MVRTQEHLMPQFVLMYLTDSSAHNSHRQCVQAAPYCVQVVEQQQLVDQCQYPESPTVKSASKNRSQACTCAFTHHCTV